MSEDLKPRSKDAVACQTLGAVAGIGGLLALGAGILLKDDPVGLSCTSIGFVCMVGGLLVFLLGTILRVWK